MNILIAVLLLGVIILIHELGHFLAARYFKMPVTEFSIGMGPELYSYYTGKTLYSIRIIPIGGYVNIAGMDIEDKTENGFNSKPPFPRLVVLLAGVFMNFVLALVIIIGMTFSSGKLVQSHEAVVGNILKEAKASKVLAEGDIIREIEGNPIVNWEEIGKNLQKLEKEKINLVIERKENLIPLEVELTKFDGEERAILGVIPKFTKESYSFSEGMKASFMGFGRVFTDTLEGIKMLITGKVAAEEISGPIGIIKVVGDASKTGSFMLMAWLVAVLSINVGLFNLIPFPALDGGRTIFVLLEMVGVKISKKLEERVHLVGILILFGLIIFATTNDFSNLLNS